MSRTKKGICGLCYHSPGCGVIIHFNEDDEIVALEPDPGVPMGKELCPIADSVHEIVYSNRRIKHPLKRCGIKGNYEFEKISWDSAFEIIADRLNQIKEKHGPESVGFYAGTGTYERSYKDVFQVGSSKTYLASSILFPFGSPNTFGVGAPCYTSLGVLAPQTTMGCVHTEMYSDLDNSDLIIVWGTNPATATPPTNFTRLKVALEEGARVIVIDPRKTECAQLDGAQWIPIRPGTDGALALGLCHVLIRDKLFAEDFVEEWTLGFEEFSAYVKAFNPSVVSGITSISEERIESLAKEIYHAEGASYVMYTGLEYSKSGVQSIRAVMTLWAIAGQLDVIGGRGFLMRGNGIPTPKERLIDNPDYDASIGKEKFPVYAHYCHEPHASLLPKSILESDPYKIRSLIVQGASIATSWPNPYVWRKALSELEFLVCIDLQMTSDAAFADIVLPATTGFEIESYCYYGCTARIREKIIEPIGESRPDYQIMTELAGRLGYGDVFPQNADDVLKHFLSSSDLTLEEWKKDDNGVIRNCHLVMEYKKWEKGLLRPDGRPGFNTPSGKFEIKSTILEKYDYPGLPMYLESDETPVSRPEMAQKYPLILGTGCLKPDMKTCLRAIPSLMEKTPYPIVEINTVDADRRGLATGDVVVIKTVRGEVIMRAIVTKNIVEGVVYAAVGGGGPLGTEEWKQSNVNDLTDMEQYDEISGFPVYKVLLCEVSKKKRIRKGTANQMGSLGCSG